MKSNIAIFFLLFATISVAQNFEWNKKHIKKAAKIGLDTSQVIILASIVEKETPLKSEKPKIARVYLNRLKQNMALQSDPTILFLLKDSTIKKINKNNLNIKSPYNTYLNKGLPPGKICEPSKESILAVLNANKNNYIYFCSKPDFSGRFNYAKTLKEHNKNIKLYIEALNKSNIN